MDAAARRRSEIEAKKAKLQELRRLRENRESKLSQLQAKPIVKDLSIPPASATNRKDIDDLVESLIGNARSTQTNKTSFTELVDSKDSSDKTQQGSTVDGSTLTQLTDQELTVSAVHEETADGAISNRSEAAAPIDTKDTPTVVVVKTPSAPQLSKVETYSKGTQTQTDTIYDDEDEDAPRTNENLTLESQEELIARLRLEIEEEYKLKAFQDEKTSVAREVDNVSLQKTDVDDALDTTGSGEASGTMVLSVESKDVHDEHQRSKTEQLPDYTQDLDTSQQDSNSGQMNETFRFQDESTKRRMITDLDWSAIFPELVLASYSKNRTLLNTTPGLVHVWNTRAPLRPEFTLRCRSQVQQAIFSPYHANIIIGGTYSGQVVIWDTRTKDQPALTTPLNGRGHTYPITGLHVIGTRQSHSIVSTSSDGTVCTWSPDLLAVPQEMFELALLPPSKVEEVTPTAVSHTALDTSSFVIGTESGDVYSVNRQDRAGAKAGIDPKVIYRGHAAMVTGVDHHRTRGQFDLGDLVLTSSLDWTIRLWRIKGQTAVTVLNGYSTGQSIRRPLLEIETEDMVYDVRWSPARPGVFASVDGTGECHLYDLCQSMDVPVARGHAVGPSTTGGRGDGKTSFNRVLWDHGGSLIAAGGIDGTLSVFEVPLTLSGREKTTNEEWQQLKSRIRAVENK